MMLDDPGEKSLLSVSPLLLRKRLLDIEKQHRSTTEVQPAQAKTQAVIMRLEHGDRESLTAREWGYLAWGLCVPTAYGDKLIAKTEICEAIILHFSKTFSKNVRRHSWFGLLFSYFSLEASEYECPPKGWMELRRLLQISFQVLYDNTKNPRDWMQTLKQHPEILGNNPASTLARLALSEKSDFIANIRKTLHIPGNSWLWSELIKEQLRQVCLYDDKPFIDHIDTILLSGKEHPTFQNEILLHLLNRHAESKHADIPHDSLKRAAIEQWGNPQLSTTARWGQVPAKTKRMVMNWFAQEDLEHFFSLLQEGGQTDQRRLRYWMRFVKQIDYTRTLLGQDACFNRDIDFVNFRKKNLGRFSQLTEQPKKSNNAFMMKIGSYYIVEFSETGNACYIYNVENLPFITGKSSYTLSEMKNKNRAIRTITHSHSGWEYNFDTHLRSLGIFPDPSLQNKSR